ncbi:hypothetical protein B0J17DRAFT_634162 [Rhizoctonia solani]|nr:hypothetical protein B0J17DRAFT_634162 [Rhizoctonia solani]
MCTVTIEEACKTDLYQFGAVNANQLPELDTHRGSWSYARTSETIDLQDIHLSSCNLSWMMVRSFLGEVSGPWSMHPDKSYREYGLDGPVVNLREYDGGRSSGVFLTNTVKRQDLTFVESHVEEGHWLNAPPNNVPAGSGTLIILTDDAARTTTTYTWTKITANVYWSHFEAKGTLNG